MIKSTIKSILPILVLSASSAYGQVDFFWNQQSVYNPAATGLDDRISVRATMNRYRGGLIAQQFSADVQSKKLHGALGLGYSSIINGKHYQARNPYLNYAFHAKTGENSLLSIGAGFGYHRSSYQSPGGNDQHYEAIYSNLGMHFRYKNFNVGTSMRLATEDGVHYRLLLETLSADYTFKFKNDWSLQVAGILTGSLNSVYGNRGALTVRARHKDIGFGATRYGNGVGAFVEWNATEKLTLGYSINFGNATYNSSNYSLVGQSVMLKFRIP